MGQVHRKLKDGNLRITKFSFLGELRGSGEPHFTGKNNG